MNGRTILAALVVSFISLPAYADATVTAGNWSIAAAAGQSVDVDTLAPIAVTITSPGESCQGVDLLLSVSAGGPIIEAVDLVGPGTIFASNNTGQSDLLPLPGADVFSSTTTAAGAVLADGVLAFVTFDATGVAPGVYSFSLSNFLGMSAVPPLASILVDGTLTVGDAGIAALTATKTDALENDVDGQGDFDPGDTLRYTVVVENVGGGDAMSVAFADTPDASSPLVAGSVSTSQGIVTLGNGGTDTSVEVDIGTIQAGDSVTVTFDVVLVDPLPECVASVSNQGVVTAAGIAAVSTDDPDTPAAGDATQTDVATALEACQEEAAICESNLDGCTDDLGRCTSHLMTCQEALGAALDDLAACLNNPAFEDADADGEHDDTDRCPGTPAGEPVDQAGCSLAEFCGSMDIDASHSAAWCNRADWQNDEPLGASDCKARQGLCEPR